MPSHSRTQDLIAFVASLATGTALVVLGVPPESLTAVAVALAALYAVWRGARPGR